MGGIKRKKSTSSAWRTPCRHQPSHRGRPRWLSCINNGKVDQYRADVTRLKTRLTHVTDSIDGGRGTRTEGRYGMAMRGVLSCELQPLESAFFLSSACRVQFFSFSICPLDLGSRGRLHQQLSAIGVPTDGGDTKIGVPWKK